MGTSNDVCLSATTLAQENKCSCTGFLQGAVLTGLCPVAPSLLLCTRFARSFVAATSFVRHPALSTTGTRPSNRRVLVPVDRAARDLAYHFYFLPVDRISWAIPYLPNNLWIQLVISRIAQDTERPLDPIAARFTLLRRPGMGRTNPAPQDPDVASSSTAAAAAATSEGPQDQEAAASLGDVAGTAHSAEATGQELEEGSAEPPLVPRVTTGVSSSQPTFTPPGSETAGAEEADEVAPADSPATEVLPVETNTLESLVRQEPEPNTQVPKAEAELQTGTAASRGEVLEAQDDSLGHANADEPPFDVFSLLGPPKIEPTAKEEVEEEVYADPSTSPVGLPPLHTHNHPTQFESLATDPVFDEAEVDFGDEELGDDLDD